MRKPGPFRVGPHGDPDRYVLGGAVGGGAEGVLHRGTITTADGVILDVAIKMLHPRFLPRVEEWRARWSDQVELLRSLRFPGVVGVRDGFLGPLPHPAGDAGDDVTLYLVMNWVEGHSLDEWVRHRPGHDPFDTLKLLLPVAGALDVMHSGAKTGGVPVVHRDVKPSNIVVTEDGGVLVDFGLIRGLPAGHRISGVTGTRGYLAPEAVEAGIYTAATDRYALGAVGFFVFTGREPPTSHQPTVLRAELDAVPALAGRPEAVDHLMAMVADDAAARPAALANWVGQLRNSTIGGTGLGGVVGGTAAQETLVAGSGAVAETEPAESMEAVPAGTEAVATTVPAGAEAVATTVPAGAEADTGAERPSEAQEEPAEPVGAEPAEAPPAVVSEPGSDGPAPAMATGVEQGGGVGRPLQETIGRSIIAPWSKQRQDWPWSRWPCSRCGSSPFAPAGSMPAQDHRRPRRRRRDLSGRLRPRRLLRR